MFSKQNLILQCGCLGQIISKRWREILMLLLLLLIFIRYRLSVLRFSYYNPYILQQLPVQSEQIYDALSADDYQQLQANTPFLNVHYIWCAPSTQNFEYIHYLGMMNIVKHIRPDQIFFHYANFPNSEHFAINWINDLKRDVAILNFKPLKENGDLCSNSVIVKYENLNGVFVKDHIFINKLDRKFVISKLAMCQDSTCYKDGIYPPPGKLILTTDSNTKNERNVAYIECGKIHSNLIPEKCAKIANLTNHKPFKVAKLNPIYNVKTLTNSKSISSHGHIVSKVFSFEVYCSIESAVSSGSLKTIFYHGQELPTNSYWRKLKELNANIHFVKMDSKTFPKSLSSLLLYSFYILLQYGGILFTENIVWKNQIPAELLKYEAIAWSKKHKEFTFDILIAKPGASFLQSLIPVTKDLISRSQNDLINYVAYHIFETYPESVFPLMTTPVCQSVLEKGSYESNICNHTLDVIRFVNKQDLISFSTT